MDLTPPFPDSESADVAPERLDTLDPSETAEGGNPSLLPRRDFLRLAGVGAGARRRPLERSRGNTDGAHLVLTHYEGVRPGTPSLR